MESMRLTNTWVSAPLAFVCSIVSWVDHYEGRSFKWSPGAVTSQHMAWLWALAKSKRPVGA